MDYKDILVFLDAGPDTPARLDLGISLARSHGARLLGVDVCRVEAFTGETKDEAMRLPDLFETRIAGAGVEGTYRVVDESTAEWKELYTRFCDLVIVSQPDEGSAKLVRPSLPDDVLLKSGVPVLILPAGWLPSPVGEDIVIAWNPSREATRATHDALPLLKRARRVTLFEFAPPADHGEIAADLMLKHLRSHGVNAQLYTWPEGSEMSPASALFACLGTQDADLIVAGAYGHSRLRERLFEGVTRRFLERTTLPMLMSH